MSQKQSRILVVDDDRLVLATLVHGLAQAGFEVIDADNGDDAILLARSQQPDLALLDIRMEGKSGFDVAAYLREHGQTPFMFLSAFSDDATLAQARALGAVACLVKPLDMQQLVPAVQAALADARQRQQAAPPPAAPTTPTAPTAPAVPDPTAAAPSVVVAMAAGVLMHRHSLHRGVALERLETLARRAGQPLDVQAERVLEAVELLALPDPG